MIRRLLLLILLAAIIVVVWEGARWVGHSRSLEATVIFDDHTALRAGDPVIHGEKIGAVRRVTMMGDQEAVAIRVDRDQRNALRSDSLIRVNGSDGRHELIVDSNFAIGRPVEDGAVIHARDSAVARLVERGGEAIAPAAQAVRQKAASMIATASDHVGFDEQLDRWSERLPQWRAEGSASVDRHIAEAKKNAAATEERLRKAGRNLEADQIKSRFDGWLASAKKRISSIE